MTAAIQFEHLTKVFSKGKKKFAAVNDVSLTVEAGQVFGFLGPNGAGKTTTIRMLMALIHPTHGSAQIAGQDVRKPETLRRVGALVEGPAFYGYLSGYENLAVLAKTRQCFQPTRIKELLGQVGLGAAMGQLASQYSLGMKQRLGLAAALLHDPALLILDEPTNGLDPAGIIEMRGFIRRLVTDQGKTVFISSHLLNEVEQVCDRVAIINKGEIIREGAVSALLKGRSQVLLDVEPAAQAVHVLSDHWPVSIVEGGMVNVEIERDRIPEMIKRLVEAGVQVYQLTPERQSLEEYFLLATNEPPPAADAEKSSSARRSP